MRASIFPKTTPRKVAVVTGASGGLGHAFCRELARTGYHVVGTDIHPMEPMENVEFIPLDVTDFDACVRVIDEIRTRHSRIDLLINNAGISHQSVFRKTEISVLRRVMEVNFFGSVHMTKAALELLLNCRGQILVVSSIAGFSPLLDRSGYSASKHALHGFFESLRTELEGSGVEVTLVCPSFVATGIERSALGGDGKPAGVVRKTAGREFSAEEMAERILGRSLRGKTLILPTLLARLAYWISRLAPQFYAKKMRKKMLHTGALLLSGTIASLFSFSTNSFASSLRLQVLDSTGNKPLPGVMITEIPAEESKLDTADGGFPVERTHWASDYRITRFTDASGRVAFENRNTSLVYRLRKDGYHEIRVEISPSDSKETGLKRIVLRPESDSKKRAEERPALSWLSALNFSDPTEKSHFRLQCAFCHQQGNSFTRVDRSPEEWKSLIDRMIGYGSRIPTSLRKKLPELLSNEWKRLHENPESIPAPNSWGAELSSFSLKEWRIGSSMSQVHDLIYASNGLVYIADNIQDRLYELNPKTNDVVLYKIPHRAGESNGGIIAARLRNFPSHDSTSNAHSLAESKVDGHIFITPSAQRRLIEFDPQSKTFRLHEMEDGLYPHTVRIDSQDRVWFTLALSNQVASFDRKRERFKIYDLPARSLGERFTLFLMPTFFRLMKLGIPISSWINIDTNSTGVPLPYGIEVTPSGKIWFTRLHTREIGSIDPNTDKIEMIQTPFLGPRRLRADGDGKLWITSYGESLISQYDPTLRKFKTFNLPSLPLGNDTPYALHVDRHRKLVYVTGNQSDSVMVLNPATEKWTFIPLPRRTFFGRDIDFDNEGNAFISNSNFPSWHIEEAQPSLVQIGAQTR